MVLPLEGIKVIELGVWVVGPTCARVLGELGADVIKIENPRGGDPIRGVLSSEEMAALGLGFVNPSWEQFNGSKRAIAVDLSQEAGKEIVYKLVKMSDVFMTNLRASAVDRLVMDYESLAKINPRIIMFSTCNQGQTGPRRSQPGFGSHLTAIAGFTSITGWPDRRPSVPWGPYTDYASIHFATFALTAALEYQHRTGKGQHLDLSQYESSVHLLTPLLLDYQVNGREFTRMGNRSQCAAPHSVYPCKGKERWCAIAIFSDDEWHRFCQVSGKPSWLSDPRFSTLTKRKENEDELDRLIGEWAKDFSAEELMVMLQSVGISAGIVENTKDLSEDPQLKYRHYFKELEHPEIGKYLCEGNAFSLSKTLPDFRMPAPCLGEHNEYVYTKVLGMSDEEFTELLSEGVFE